ncbi:PLP-dependent transferase [Sporocytophaga myxococcoides]|uniref:PLP-dependent transferase n=1 Tax=Sporocytophaga myxococcoides TaxID=153721 RepID=UPI0004270C7C|nr:PLP-dependent transferase [Sporocytophaga myxococcoides]
MKSIQIDKITHSHLNDAAEDSLHFNTTWDTLRKIEKKVAISESGIEALAFKSIRSARYTLIKNIVGERKNILTFHLGVWEIEAFKRNGIKLFFAKDYSDTNLKDIIALNNIGVIYLQTIDSLTLAVEDLSHIIEQAHQSLIPVIIDNSAGGLGKIFNPLEIGADFVITSVQNYSAFNNTAIGAFVVQGLNSWQKKDLFQMLIQKSLLEELKEQREKNIAPEFLITDITGELIENQLNIEEKKYKEYSSVAFQLAKWLNQLETVMEVSYPGLKSSISNLNAERFSKGGFGNRLKFNLWDDKFSFGLLKGFFVAGKPEGLIIDVNTTNREFIIEIKVNNLQVVLEYFQQVFTQLNNEVNYRLYLSRQLELEQALQKFLSFGVPIALIKEKLTNQV